MVKSRYINYEHPHDSVFAILLCQIILVAGVNQPRLEAGHSLLVSRLIIRDAIPSLSPVLRGMC